MKRRSVRQWIAGILKIQPHIDEAARHELIETGIRLGVALVTQKPAHESYRGYGRLVSEQAQFAAYEPPDRQTGPNSPLANPEQLRKFLNTESLPAVPQPGDVARAYHRKHGKAE